MKLILTSIFVAACALQAQIVRAEDPFPASIPVRAGSPPEGFTIGVGTTAYNGSIDGSIYKFDLRTGEGGEFVPPEPDVDVFNDCYKLGMRVDPRSNYLFVAGCLGGNAYVFDADTGEAIATYELAPAYSTVINDLAITTDAVFFTDFTQPYLYRLPLTANGQLPAGAASTPILLSNDVGNGPLTANGIIATPDGKTLIIGDSATANIYRVDPATGYSDRIAVNPPLVGFIDGIVLHRGMLYILTPADPSDPTDIDRVQVVALDKELLTGTVVGVITGPGLDGVASGAVFGSSLYVNNARYTTFPEADTAYWVTKLNVHDVQP